MPALEPAPAVSPTSGRSDPPQMSSIAGYCVPLVLFGVFTEIETRVPAALYPYVYVSKLVAVMIGFAVYKWTLRDLKPSRAVVGPAVFVGLAVFAEWVLLDK